MGKVAIEDRPPVNASVTIEDDGTRGWKASIAWGTRESVPDEQTLTRLRELSESQTPFRVSLEDDAGRHENGRASVYRYGPTLTDPEKKHRLVYLPVVLICPPVFVRQPTPPRTRPPRIGGSQ